MYVYYIISMDGNIWPEICSIPSNKMRLNEILKFESVPFRGGGV